MPAGSLDFVIMSGYNVGGGVAQGWARPSVTYALAESTGLENDWLNDWLADELATDKHFDKEWARLWSGL